MLHPASGEELPLMLALPVHGQVNTGKGNCVRAVRTHFSLSRRITYFASLKVFKP